MYYAYANKDQMKVWKSARKAINDGEPEPPTTKVMLHVKTTDKGMVANLTATDSYQMMQRNICVSDGYTEGDKSIDICIPGDGVKLAEKSMTPKDRAYFDDNKIIIMAITEDEYGEEMEVTKASIPFTVQTELFKNWSDLLIREEKEGVPDRIVMIDAQVLKRITDQLKSGQARVYINLSLRDEDSSVIISAFPDIEDEALRAVIMPVKG